MNVIIGRIYQAPWGRYVGHREGVLRSLDNSGAFSVQPSADDFIDTGEDLHVPQRSDRRDPSPAAQAERREAAPVPECGDERSPRVPLAVQDAGRADPPDLDLAGGPTGRDAHPNEDLNDPRTLGGLRPGSIYCVVPKMPQLQWKPCLVRAEDGTGPHVYFLESTDHLSLFCGPCRARRPLSFVGHKTIVAHINGLVAAGKVAEARGIAEGTRAPRVTNIDELEEIAESPASVVELKIANHCCPRIVLGHGLHSPVCKNYVGETTGPQAPADVLAGSASSPERAGSSPAAVTMPALPRDDPKAEAGSFERVMPWRPKYRDRADWDEWRRERAAIIEYEGGISRKYAEIAANRLAGPPP